MRARVAARSGTHAHRCAQQHVACRRGRTRPPYALSARCYPPGRRREARAVSYLCQRACSDSGARRRAHQPFPVGAAAAFWVQRAAGIRYLGPQHAVGVSAVAGRGQAATQQVEWRRAPALGTGRDRACTSAARLIPPARGVSQPCAAARATRGAPERVCGRPTTTCGAAARGTRFTLRSWPNAARSGPPSLGPSVDAVYRAGSGRVWQGGQGMSGRAQPRTAS